jgi:hypothetical protein
MPGEKIPAFLNKESESSELLVYSSLKPNKPEAQNANIIILNVKFNKTMYTL